MTMAQRRGVVDALHKAALHHVVYGIRGSDARRERADLIDAMAWVLSWEDTSGLSDFKALHQRLRAIDSGMT